MGEKMITKENWAFSSLNKQIVLYASAPFSALSSQRPILLMGGIHGDEPEGVWLAEKTLRYLTGEPAEVKAPWILIPCLNVDGFASRTRVNGRGVDLNRNYPSQSWSPAFEKERYHPGPAPGSEPEVQAVVKLIGQMHPRIIIHCHSWKPCIVCAGGPGLRDAERLSLSSGYEVMPEIGYPTPGSLSQFGWADHGIPIICVEEKSGAPESDLWPHFGAGMREIFADPGLRDSLGEIAQE